MLRFIRFENAKAPDEPGPSVVMPNLLGAGDDDNAARDAVRNYRPTAVPGPSIRPTR